MWCKFIGNSGFVMGAKIRILKIHDELASLAHCQQAHDGSSDACSFARFLVSLQLCQNSIEYRSGARYSLYHLIVAQMRERAQLSIPRA